MSAWEITNIVAYALMPPGCLLLLTAAGLALLHRRRRWGVALISVAWLALYLLSTTYVSDRLLRTLEPAYQDPVAQRTVLAFAGIDESGVVWTGSPQVAS